ncbi:flavodoxin [bacterium]|nr:flavodoxin [bacterium]
MKSLIIYISIHNKNTEKIANVIASELDSEIVKVAELKNFDVSQYDVIGFGSGIYMSNFSGFIINVIRKMKGINGKKVFIFSTSGNKKTFFNNFDKKIKEELNKKEAILIGNYNCPGFDTFGPFKLIGGLNKGRPNEKDIAEAKVFAGKIKEAI